MGGECKESWGNRVEVNNHCVLEDGVGLNQSEVEKLCKSRGYNPRKQNVEIINKKLEDSVGHKKKIYSQLKITPHFITNAVKPSLVCHHYFLNVSHLCSEEE